MMTVKRREVIVRAVHLKGTMTRSDPEFWQPIEARRKASRTVSADEMRYRLGAPRKVRPKRQH